MNTTFVYILVMFIVCMYRALLLFMGIFIVCMVFVASASFIGTNDEKNDDPDVPVPWSNDGITTGMLAGISLGLIALTVGAAAWYKSRTGKYW